MVSHEDGAELGDLKPHTRALMAAAEKDLGTPLDWIAVDHHNTGRPHTHVIIRGRADDGRDLVIAKDYLTKGLRRRASELVTEALGPRRDLEIMRAEQADVVRDRYTGLDRRVFNRARNNALDLEKPTNSGARFDDALARRRLRYLEQLGLARRLSTNQWQLSNDWNETLRQMGRRDDIVRAITAKYRETDIANRVRIYDPSQTKGASLQGRIVGSVPVDELHSRRHLIVEGVDGLTWSIDVGPNPSGSLPGKGSLVEIMPTTPAPKRSDQTIARIAALNDGKWSEALHAENDPSSTKEYRLAHKRRLEALRRAGLVERKADGVWKIGSDYLGRTTQFEARKTGGAQIVHLTSKSLTSMETADAHTWLDRVDASGFAETGFGSEVKRAQVQRLDWLREQGLVAVGEQRLSATAVSSLEARELTRLVKSETETSGRVGGVLDQGRAFSGKFEKIIESHQGRLALVGTETRFALTPMRAKKGSALGRELTVTRKGQSIDWAFGRKRGPSR
jgi:type IV secretory pathway VirD2 relaxase